ncbi:tRNA guanine-N1--methyltransferase [Heterostelium album PN500]|uniref:tRNA (guanine(37)-N(1))-methyltransferase n=1 Tax=Heterostelium pallidum (strain ATCC 26659 / Pp 5 / PN500) TaxID=670386 RepID=TRM5_HETP5|nr:tRNA guanine-N1--methyltransferase [Heterostelium album PN500]D3BT31.1 RecName: Full=tRNA (guanine(37)-N1)-methyltransferase; AltName: Full=M1G-methyltransferase; AltName: Full=tRNA [GM37] methyltransferase; AltName: Full=tRNA methyltransferase 5 homolog [Heterostelium album PN500]EFA75248.1 tRNA guanine-N1--methyltransferase [Heterostelium album PN500]|eukprot:XP_020427382.1 tRNA guanine-N1--methyltransferase [Heterostelium album PN500]
MSSLLLNKEIFSKSISIVGLKVNKTLLKTLAQEFKGYLLIRDRVKHIVDDSDSKDKKLVLLSESIENGNVGAYGVNKQLPDNLQSFLKTHSIEVVKHQVQLNYNNFSYEEVMKELIPTGLPIPHAFEKIGHIAHLNLKEELLPYKNMIGQVILDKKGPQIRTVLNKVGKIDTVFRTFNFELLAGDNDLLAQVVYWNSRLQFEHSNLIQTFKSHDIVVDMFAGVGPFAVPASKLVKCKVYANDLNPNSVKYMRENATRNKASTIEISNLDARDFVRELVSRDPPVAFTQAIMNLPSTSIEFLDVFREIFLNPEKAPPIPAPTIHCYTFTPVSETAGGDLKELTIKNVEAIIKHPLPADTTVYEVRDVSPNKRMMRISFKMPTLKKRKDTENNDDQENNNNSSNNNNNNKIDYNEAVSSGGEGKKIKH